MLLQEGGEVFNEIIYKKHQVFMVTLTLFPVLKTHHLYNYNEVKRKAMGRGLVERGAAVFGLSAMHV